jgi:hypothetical protein
MSPPAILAMARRDVINQHQYVVEGPDGIFRDPTYQNSGQCWKSTPCADRPSAEISRGRAQTTDQNGKTLSIEQIASSGAPTLVFIDYDGPGGPGHIAKELVKQLELRGVATRN